MSPHVPLCRWTHLLLVLDAPIDRDKSVEDPAGGQKQQEAVSGTRPIHPLNRVQHERLGKRQDDTPRRIEDPV